MINLLKKIIEFHYGTPVPTPPPFIPQLKLIDHINQSYGVLIATMDGRRVVFNKVSMSEQMGLGDLNVIQFNGGDHIVYQSPYMTMKNGDTPLNEVRQIKWKRKCLSNFSSVLHNFL